MKYCPKCKTENVDQALFCNSCGFSFKEHNKKVKKRITIIIISLIVLFILGLLNNLRLESKYLKPLKLNTKNNDTTLSFSSSYNKDNKAIYLDIYTNETIEKWQVNTLGNNKKTAILKIKINDIDESLESKPITLINGKKMVIRYQIDNATLSDFVDIKKELKANKYKITLAENICFTKRVRQQKKKAYYDAIAKQRAIARQREIERQRSLQNFYDYLNSLNSYYDYYY